MKSALTRQMARIRAHRPARSAAAWVVATAGCLGIGGAVVVPAGAAVSMQTAIPVPPKVSLAAPVKVSGEVVRIPLACQAATGATCRGTIDETVTTTKRVTRVTSFVAKTTYSLGADQTKTVTVPLDATGRKALAKDHDQLTATLNVTSTSTSGKATKVTSQKITLTVGARTRHLRPV